MAQRETPMWMVDPESFRFASINDAAVKLFGYSREQLSTMSIFAVLAPEEIENLRNALHTRPSAGDGGTWTLLVPPGHRVRIHTHYHFTEVDGHRQQFTFVSEIYGHPAFCDGPTAGIGASAAG